MTLAIVFRTSNPSLWGPGSTEDLAADVIDNNMWLFKTSIEQLQADMPDAAVGIEDFSVTNNQFTVLMTDGSSKGPYTLPTTTWEFKDEWQASTPYNINDVFVEGYALYLVIYAHTSNLTFDAGANDGLGHDYYRKLFDFEPFATPVGGTTGQVLQKASNTDRDFVWYTIPEPVTPPGDNTLVFDYLSTELINDGDLSLDPSTVFPAFTLNDNVWSAGSLSVTYTGPENPVLDVPVADLEVGAWYLFTFTGTVTGDLNSISAISAHVDNMVFGGSGQFAFQANAITDTFSFDLLNYNPNASRVLTSFSCHKISQPSLLAMKNGDQKVIEFGIGDGNVFIGDSAGASKGLLSVATTPTLLCIGIGSGALEHSQGSIGNIAIGAGVLKENKSNNNIGIGNFALMNNNSYNNIAIGQGAMADAPLAYNNIVIGYTDAIYTWDNVIIGDGGRVNKDGYANILIGQNSPLTNGFNCSHNIIIGWGAAFNGGTGGATFQNNTFIGDNTNSAAATENSVALGYGAVVTGSNTVQLGNSSVKKAYVGTKAIGLPQHLLVSGTTPGNVSVTGLKLDDRIDEVIYFPGAGGVFDLTSEFYISSDGVINNSAGTDSTGGKLLVRWTSLT